jgi:hypothetical protein
MNKLIILALTMLCSVSAKAQSIYYDPTAVEICKQESQKPLASPMRSCLEKIKNKHYDPRVISVCVPDRPLENRISCLRRIENKIFLSDVEIDACKSEMDTPGVLSCLNRIESAPWTSDEENESIPSTPACTSSSLTTEKISALRKRAEKIKYLLNTGDDSGGRIELINLLNALHRLEAESKK